MKSPTTFLFRKANGRIVSATGESATQAVGKLGQLLSWDGDLNTLDVVVHGVIEHWTFEGHREGARS